ELFDQRLDLVLAADHVLDIAADGEPYMPLGKLIRNIAELADRVCIHLALGAGTHCPDPIAVEGDMMQHARARSLVPCPLSVVLRQQRMHELERVRNPAFDGLAKRLL